MIFLEKPSKEYRSQQKNNWRDGSSNI